MVLCVWSSRQFRVLKASLVRVHALSPLPWDLLLATNKFYFYFLRTASKKKRGEKSNHGDFLIWHRRAQWACLTYHAACKVEFQPPIGRSHNWRFSIFFIKSGCEYCLTNIARACNFFNHRCGKCALSCIENWWENVILPKRVLSRLTAPLTWAASLSWTSAVTCCNIYREYY